VIMMAKSYSKVLKEYPEYITKEQLYRICQVSKKTALYYLESGIIPAIDSGKQTHRFTIATKDVVAFLKKRDKNPALYRAQPGWYQGNSGYKRKLPYLLFPLERCETTKARLDRWLEDYPDLMKPTDITKATGYVLDTVIDWCSSDKLHHFIIRKAFLIPKLSLMDFMLSDDFKGIKVKRDEYDDFLSKF